MLRRLAQTLAVAVVAGAAVVGVSAPANAAPAPVHPSAVGDNPQVDPAKASLCDPTGSGQKAKGIPDDEFLPLTRWSDATSDFHTRLSWSDIEDKATRGVIMANGMAVGNAMLGWGQGIVSSAMGFCISDELSLRISQLSSAVGSALFSNQILALAIGVALVALVLRGARSGMMSGNVLRPMMIKVGIVALFAVMVAGGATGKGSPHWWATTIDRSVSTVAALPATAMMNMTQATTELGTNPNVCDQMRSVLHDKYRNEAGTTTPQEVMSSLWENSGLRTWQLAQFGARETVDPKSGSETGRTVGDRVYCHYLEMETGQSATGRGEVYKDLGFTGVSAGDAQGATLFSSVNPMRDVALVAWAACDPSPKQGKLRPHPVLTTKSALKDQTAGGAAIDKGTDIAGSILKYSPIGVAVQGVKNGVDAVTGDDEKDAPSNHHASFAVTDKTCKMLFGDKGTGAGASATIGSEWEIFNWGNDQDEIIAATSGADDNDAVARDFILTLHGNKNFGGLAGVATYQIAALSSLIVFGGLALAIIFAKLVAAIYLIAIFFVLLVVLFTGDTTRLVQFAKAFVGITLFGWGAMALLGVLSVISFVLIEAGNIFPTWIQILWTGLTPLLSAWALHKLFKDVLHIQSPFKPTAALGYASAMKRGGFAAAANGFNTASQPGAMGQGMGFLKRAGATALGTELSEKYDIPGIGRKKGGTKVGERDGEMTPGGPTAPAGGGTSGQTGERPFGPLTKDQQTAHDVANKTAAGRQSLVDATKVKNATTAEKRKARRALNEFEAPLRREAAQKARDLRKDAWSNKSVGQKFASGAGTAAKVGAISMLAGPAAPLAAVGVTGAYLATRAGRDSLAARGIGKGSRGMRDAFNSIFDENEPSRPSPSGPQPDSGNEGGKDADS